MPFLNCIEHNDQYQLVQLIPKLFADLKTGVFVREGLRNFHVPWTHVAMDKQELVLELDNYLMTKMCNTAGESLGLQCPGNTGLKLRKVIEQLQFKDQYQKKEQTYPQKTFRPRGTLPNLASLLLCLQGIQIASLKLKVSEMT